MNSCSTDTARYLRVSVNLCCITVPRNQSGAVPISSLLSVGSWGSGKLEGWDNWVKGGANGVSLQAT